MSSPRISVASDDSREIPTTRKRSCINFLLDSLDDMPPLKLDIDNDADKADEAPPPRKCRKLPSFIGADPTATPPSSQESEKMEVGVLATLRKLQCAYECLLRMIQAAEESRMYRYEMCGESPEGSQNSFVVSYSQDSKLSGDEPPKIEEIIGIIIETLPEMKLQQLFPFKNVDDTETRVRIAVPFLHTDLGLLNELVKEAMAAIIIETLPEMRLQQLFPFGDVDDTEARVRIAVPFLNTDLGLLNELVKEAMDAMRVSATVIARTAS
jgi:hypothetical protein